LSTGAPAEPAGLSLRAIKLDLNFKNIYDRMFLILLVVDMILRLLWLDKPNGSLIFDEWYYVNVARVVLGLPQSKGSNGLPPYQNAPIGIDPNHEHPPLAKLLIALSMHFLGDNGFGWRIPSVIFGSLAILVFYLLMKRLATYPIVPIVATFLFSFDNLIFVQSRIATLDIFTLTFMLLGFYWYFSGHTYLSALGMALSTLTKINGVFGFIIIIIMQVAKFITTDREAKSWGSLFGWFEKYVAVFAVAFLGILTVLDRFWGGYSNPLSHVQFILNYSAGLVSSCPNGIISCPWQWLLNQVQIPYLTVNVAVTAGNVTRSFTSVSFTGALNPAILYLTIPAMLYAGYSYYQQKRNLTLFSVVWFAVAYMAYLPLVIIGHRVTYLFYFLLPMPAVCAVIAHMIADQNPPKLVLAFYLGVVLLAFYFMFPFKIIPT